MSDYEYIDFLYDSDSKQRIVEQPSYTGVKTLKAIDVISAVNYPYCILSATAEIVNINYTQYLQSRPRIDYGWFFYQNNFVNKIIYTSTALFNEQFSYDINTLSNKVFLRLQDNDIGCGDMIKNYTSDFNSWKYIIEKNQSSIRIFSDDVFYDFAYRIYPSPIYKLSSVSQIQSLIHKLENIYDINNFKHIICKIDNVKSDAYTIENSYSLGNRFDGRSYYRDSTYGPYDSNGNYVEDGTESRSTGRFGIDTKTTLFRLQAKYETMIGTDGTTYEIIETARDGYGDVIKDDDGNTVSNHIYVPNIADGVRTQYMMSCDGEIVIDTSKNVYSVDSPHLIMFFKCSQTIKDKAHYAILAGSDYDYWCDNEKLYQPTEEEKMDEFTIKTLDDSRDDGSVYFLAKFQMTCVEQNKFILPLSECLSYAVRQAGIDINYRPGASGEPYKWCDSDFNVSMSGADSAIDEANTMLNATHEQIQEWLSQQEGPHGEYTTEGLENYIKYLNYTVPKFKTDAKKRYDYSKDKYKDGSTVDITITCRPVAAIFDFI